MNEPKAPGVRTGRRVVVVFDPAPEGGYCVHSPDIPALVTEGETLVEALEMAADALKELVAAGYETEGGN